MKGNSRAYLFALIAVILWGFSFIWANYLISSKVEILCFVFERMLIASVVLWVAGLILGKIQKIAFKDFKWFFLLAFGEPFIYFIGENYGMKFIGSAVITSVIIATIPIFSLFAEKIVYNSPLTLLKIIGVLISVPAVYFVVSNGTSLEGINTFGLLFFILSIIGSIIYSFMVIKLYNRGYNVITIVAWQFTIGALLFLPLFLIFGLKGLNSVYFSFKVQSTIFTLALLCSCLCFSLWSYVTAKLGVTRSNIFAVLIPAVSAVGAYMYGQEILTTTKMAGILLVAAGIVLVQWKQSAH